MQLYLIYLRIYLFDWDSNRLIEINKYYYHCGGNRILRKIKLTAIVIILRMGSTGRNKFCDVDDSGVIEINIIIIS